MQENNNNEQENEQKNKQEHAIGEQDIDEQDFDEEDFDEEIDEDIAYNFKAQNKYSDGQGKEFDKKEAEVMLFEVVRLLQDLRATDVVLIDTNSKNTEFLYILIGTVSSKTHLNGVNKGLDDELTMRGIEFANTKNIKNDDEWIIIDGHYFVIHLMSEKARNFYNIENLSKGYIFLKS